MTDMERYIRGRLTCVLGLLKICDRETVTTVQIVRWGHEVDVLEDILRRTSIYGTGDPSTDKLDAMKALALREAAWNEKPSQCGPADSTAAPYAWRTML